MDSQKISAPWQSPTTNIISRASRLLGKRSCRSSDCAQLHSHSNQDLLHAPLYQTTSLIRGTVRDADTPVCIRALCSPGSGQIAADLGKMQADGS